MSQCKLFFSYLSRKWTSFTRKNRRAAVCNSLLKTPLVTVGCVLGVIFTIGAALYSMWLFNMWCLDNDWIGAFKNHRDGYLSDEESAIIWSATELFGLIVISGLLIFAYAVTEESLLQIKKDMKKWDIEAQQRMKKQNE